ncbi:hypothetical protein KBI23_05570 [bacterium]|nr:hypothetical protein [bacterium]MBP9810596.1 hypothetical protein [bacterium]
MELYDVTPDEVIVGIAVEMPTSGRPYISLPKPSTDETSERCELRFNLTDGLIASSNCFSCGRLLDAVLANENGHLHLERDKSDTEAVLIRFKYGERFSDDTPSLTLETAGQANLVLETSWTEEHFDRHPEDCQPYFTLHKGALLKLLPETKVLLSRTRAAYKYKHFWHWFIPSIKPTITTVKEPIGSICFDGARVFWRQK